MKNSITISFFFTLCFGGMFVFFSASNFPDSRTHRLNASYVKKELTAHEWTLAEIVQTKNDTSTNLTLFMLPCEKDNLLDYETNGTYQITEGEKKCSVSDKKIKGTGTWAYDESDQSLQDSYSGGRRIEKKVLELSPGMLKLQFESEGRRITTLTYLSEVGKKDEGLRDLIVDNSDNTKNIAAAPRETMLEARRYNVVGRFEFDKGLAQKNFDSKGGIVPMVCVYPFMSSTDVNTTINEGERFKALIAQGKKIGLDYIVTGNIIKAATDISPDGKHQGNIKFSVSILDVKAGVEKKAKNFMYSQKEVDDKKGKDGKILGGLLGALGGGYYGWGYRRSYWDNYYGYYFYSNSTAVVANGLAVAFSSDADNGERKKYYESSIAVMDAINQTAEGLSEFIIENIPLTLKINRVDNEKKGEITVEGGDNIFMQVGERLKIVRIRSTKLSDGSDEIETTHICDVKVSEVKGMRLSACKAVTGTASKLAKALQDTPEELFVHTSEIFRPKK